MASSLERLLREWLDVADEGKRIKPAEWVTLLERLMAGSELALSTPMDQGVQVIEAQDAALTSYRHVFVVHANHGEFPRDPRTGGVLTAGERRELAEGGLPIQHRDDEFARERRLWTSVTAGEDVTVYTARYRSGTPLMPSLTVPGTAGTDSQDASSVVGSGLRPSHIWRHGLVADERGGRRRRACRYPARVRRAVLRRRLKLGRAG